MALAVNWLAVLVAAVVAWLFGALYYGVLSKPWMEAQGRSVEAFKAEQAVAPALQRFGPFVLCFVAELVIAVVLAGIMIHVGVFTIRAGIISGALCWLGFVVTTLSVTNAFGGRRAALTAIDAGHWLGVLVVMGAVLGAMGP